MTLRLRLVAGVVALLAVGFVLFGVVTISAYGRVQRQRLDDQVRSAAPLLGLQVRQAAGVAPSPREVAARAGAPAVVVPPGTYGELRDGSGDILSRVQLQVPGTTPPQPDLRGGLPGDDLLFDVGSVSGGDRWRVLVVPERDGLTVVVALPLSEVESATRRLVVIEATTALVLLVVLAAGTWLVLRRGLRPLEQMASTASTITAGDLSLRVDPADDRTEVGQLGLALNTMLEGIEASFHERERTEQQLRRFLSDASHELRTPLTSIQGFAELFRLDGDDGTAVDVPVVLRRIEEESGRMRRLVEDMLLLARVEEARTQERTEVDLAVLAADACTDAAAMDTARPVVLDTREPVVVSGVADHLRQAVANLVVNAVRHTPPGTKVEVAARIDDGRAVLEVRDHGPGLDDAALVHAFDRFWRGDPSRTGEGSGLGLSIVEGIAAEHDGTVTASNAPGGGAVFTFTVPVGPAGG